MSLKKCNSCPKPYTTDEEFRGSNGRPTKACAACRNKAKACRDKAKRKRDNKSSAAIASTAIASSSTEYSEGGSGPATRSQSKKKSRNEATKQRALKLHSGRCGISGKDGSSIDVAHHIPWNENDDPENMFTLQASLHRELDAFVFALDPSSREEAPDRPGFDVYQLKFSDKPNNWNPVCKDFTECIARSESYEFIVEAYKRFIESEFPEDTSVIGAPTRPYKKGSLSSST